jgi:hypothetical protein
MRDDGENGRLGSPTFLPWPAARPACFRLRPCVRLLGLYLRALGSLSLVSPALFSGSSVLVRSLVACAKARSSGLFPRESELPHMDRLGTDGHLARWEGSRSPIPPPRARPVIQGAVANGCALVICGPCFISEHGPYSNRPTVSSIGLITMTRYFSTYSPKRPPSSLP